ncbi:MAG: SAM-dependent methyltransferase [Desulfobacterales bacterium]
MRAGERGSVDLSGPYRWYMEALNDLNIKIIPGVSCLNAANAALGTDICDSRETRAAVLTTFPGSRQAGPAHPTW